MKVLKAGITVIAIGVLVVFVVFVVNQTNQVVLLAGNVSPLLGAIVFWGLIGFYAVVVAVPTILFVRMPRPLVPPDAAGGPEFDRHLRLLRARLQQNRLLADRSIETQADVDAALSELNRRADEIVRETASVVFLTTAVSQSGRLDGLVVLAAQSRMVWRIARLYYQRPALREMLNLYSNVAATVFVTTQLEEIDVEEQIEPIIQSAIGAAFGAMPGMTAAATLLSSSILTGSTNAFLTLRVGVITRRYCGALVRPERRSIRRVAAAEAARMLVPLVWSGSKRITTTAGAALRKKLSWKKGSTSPELTESFALDAAMPLDQPDLETPPAPVVRRRWWRAGTRRAPGPRSAPDESTD